MFADQIGEKIAVARKNRNMSQTDLAKCVSMSPQMVSKWERGESLPDVVMLKNLSEILQVDITFFYSDAAPESPVIDGPQQKNKRPLFKYTDWKNSDFSKSKLRLKNFDFANFLDCDLSGTDLTDSSFAFTTIKKCNFSESALKNIYIKSASFSESVFKGAEFTGATLHMSSFTKCAMPDIRFVNSSIRSSSFTNCGFANFYAEETVFECCGIISCQFTDATLRNAPFRHCKFKNTEFVRCKMDKVSYNFLLNSRGAIIENPEIF